jgi:uncharacterized protein (DUF362 family)/Pyruvate/2-oxoacid:ferredoxin oxidoreductase delta subunit
MKKRTFRVACVRCRSYDPAEVRKAMERAFELSGGLPPLPGKVLLKTNLLSPVEPGRAVTTHPEIVLSICEMLPDPSKAEIADNPGYIFRHQEQELFETTGMKSVEKKCGARVSLLSRDGFETLSLPGAVSLKTMRIARVLLNAPFVIDVAKLKTHVETEITGSIKNMFGATDTDTRKKAHSAIDQESFLNAVVDIYLARVPDLCVLDAVEGMEGRGPSHGRPVKPGWIAISDNALALDVVQAVMMGYRNPFSIPLLRVASKRLDGPSSLDEIELLGAEWKDLPVKDFRKAPGSIRMIPAFLRGLGHRLVILKPLLNRDKCVRCGICGKVCPVGAITLDGENYPVIDRAQCVRCLCCHEMCPAGAMEVKENIVSRLLR